MKIYISSSSTPRRPATWFASLARIPSTGVTSMAAGFSSWAAISRPVGLARNVSAFELPSSSLYCRTTFEDEAAGSSEEDAVLLTYDLQAAYVESVKRSMEDDDMEEEDDEENVEEMDLDE
ncbi:uncharacterized protein TRUGW13939_08488 [Talaromyces rugulosus]|uniref:Uncharacterized protein n=1 Tax=Talaromyces rugulosus TaxID=121627 RepID=A0A7H8R4R0_TALRU|nr:uncharacterized protein TRUGW13939_08488 [Talaromyces rugulosus]QKX61340.1 hypothetical protein TRUGW13939_08488 [Talaromyces rugulosus]